MPFVTTHVFVALATLTAAQLNGIQSNINALWPYTAAGDIAYASAADTLAILAKPSVDSVLQNTNAGLPSYLELTSLVQTLVTKRQGGSTTIWNTGGTTNYTPTPANIKRYKGVGSITLSSEQFKGVTITFPDAFTYAPHVMVSSRTSYLLVTVGTVSETQAGFYVYHIPGATSGTCYFSWEAEGE